MGFTGHVNEKNFVGLATDGDYVTCGSENNGLYVYYMGLSKHLFQFKFDAVRSFLDRERKEEEVNEFVSAVCWKQNSNVMVAANSQGTIRCWSWYDTTRPPWTRPPMDTPTMDTPTRGHA